MAIEIVKKSDFEQQMAGKVGQKGYTNKLTGSVKDLAFGMYSVNSWGKLTDAPLGANPYGTLFMLSGVSGADKVILYFPHISNQLAYVMKHYTGGEWYGWYEIPTTAQMNALVEKTAFSCTALTGYTIISQTNYTMNNMVFFSLRLKKTDNSKFAAGRHILATSPIGASSALSCYCASSDNTPLGNASGTVTAVNKTIYALLSIECDNITLGGTVIV